MTGASKDLLAAGAFASITSIARCQVDTRDRKRLDRIASNKGTSYLCEQSFQGSRLVKGPLFFCDGYPWAFGLCKSLLVVCICIFNIADARERTYPRLSPNKGFNKNDLAEEQWMFLSL